MRMRAKKAEIYRLAKKLAGLIGISLTGEITNTVRKRLPMLRREHGSDLAANLLRIGRECAAHFREPFRSIDHGEMLYDQRGLPK